MLRLMQLSPEEKAAVATFCEGVRARFGPRLREIVLFGSRARGDAHEDSDIDVCVVVDGLTWQEARDVDAVTADVLERHDVLVSPLVLSSERMDLLRSRERLIAAEIARDGVAL
jgi:predicted nucleotidyltransferase